MMPSPTSGRPSFAFSEANRMWHASASSQPPPSANPLTAAITGFPRFSISWNASWPSREDASPWSGLITDSSLMSAPATNAFSPEPVRMTAPTAGSHRIAVKQARSSRTVFSLSAFRTLGRLTVTRAIRSRMSTTRFS